MDTRKQKLFQTQNVVTHILHPATTCSIFHQFQFHWHCKNCTLTFSGELFPAHVFFPCFSLVKPLASFCLFDWQVVHYLHIICLDHALMFVFLVCSQRNEGRAGHLATRGRKRRPSRRQPLCNMSVHSSCGHPCSSAPLRLYQPETVDRGRVPLCFFLFFLLRDMFRAC
jgi:hypothetical protein